MRSLVLALALMLGACATTDHAATMRAMEQPTLYREISARFGYPAPTPLPERVEDQRAGQIADAAYFAAFPDYDRSYSPRDRVQAQRLAERVAR